jgi:hypothetical protein
LKSVIFYVELKSFNLQQNTANKKSKRTVREHHANQFSHAGSPTVLQLLAVRFLPATIS